MVALHEHSAEPLPVARAHGHHGHTHHGHTHDDHVPQADGGHRHHHHDAAHEHRAAREPRFSLIALSALQRLALVAPAILALGLLAFWATRNG